MINQVVLSIAAFTGATSAIMGTKQGNAFDSFDNDQGRHQYVPNPRSSYKPPAPLQEFCDGTSTWEAAREEVDEQPAPAGWWSSYQQYSPPFIAYRPSEALRQPI